MSDLNPFTHTVRRLSPHGRAEQLWREQQEWRECDEETEQPLRPGNCPTDAEAVAIARIDGYRWQAQGGPEKLEQIRREVDAYIAAKFGLLAHLNHALNVVEGGHG